MNGTLSDESEKLRKRKNLEFVVFDKILQRRVNSTKTHADYSYIKCLLRFN